MCQFKVLTTRSERQEQGASERERRRETLEDDKAFLHTHFYFHTDFIKVSPHEYLSRRFKCLLCSSQSLNAILSISLTHRHTLPVEQVSSFPEWIRSCLIFSFFLSPACLSLFVTLHLCLCLHSSLSISTRLLQASFVLSVSRSIYLLLCLRLTLLLAVNLKRSSPILKLEILFWHKKKKKQLQKKQKRFQFKSRLQVEKYHCLVVCDFQLHF